MATLSEPERKVQICGALMVAVVQHARFWRSEMDSSQCYHCPNKAECRLYETTHKQEVLNIEQA